VPIGKATVAGEYVGMITSRRPVARAIHRIPVRSWITATVPATAPAARSAWSRFIRYAGSPNGSRWVAMKPRITNAG
jgi:hypothetical protein